MNSTWWVVLAIVQPIQIKPDLYVCPQHDGELMVVIQVVSLLPSSEEPSWSDLLLQGDQVLWDVYLEDILSAFPGYGLQHPPGA